MTPSATPLPSSRPDVLIRPVNAISSPTANPLPVVVPMALDRNLVAAPVKSSRCALPSQPVTSTREAVEVVAVPERVQSFATPSALLSPMNSPLEQRLFCPVNCDAGNGGKYAGSTLSSTVAASIATVLAPNRDM